MLSATLSVDDFRSLNGPREMSQSHLEKTHIENEHVNNCENICKSKVQRGMMMILNIFFFANKNESSKKVGRKRCLEFMDEECLVILLEFIHTYTNSFVI